MGYFFERMVIHMKDNLKMARKVGKEFKNMLMVIYIMENLWMENVKDLDFIIGQMVVIIKVNL
jgi:hypothetical protein